MRERALDLTSWFVTAGIREQGETATTRALVLVLTAPMAIVVTLAPALAQLFDGQPTPLSPAIAAVCCLMFALGPLLLRWTASPGIAGAWMVFGGQIATAYVVYAQHGLDSILTVWLLVIPMFAGFVLGARWTLVFSLLSGLCIAGCWVLGSADAFSTTPALPEGLPMRGLNLLCALLAISALAVFWERAAEQAQRERRELEAQIQRSQTLETVGMLAGGIAHDFNNILAAILGNASLLDAELPPSNAASARRRVKSIVDSSRRAAVLVEQMLAYAGRASTHDGALDLSRLAVEVVELVRPGLDKNTSLALDLDEHVPLIVGDPVQVQQIVMNLVTNASESLLGKPGTVLVRTAVVDRAGAKLERAPTPADFVLLEVRDQGCGIAPAQLERIFDPFFTTKPSGHGLGLAAVLGIVRKHHGDIEVDSTVGVGTSFRVLMPCADAEAIAAAEPDDAPRPHVRLATLSPAARAQSSGPRRRVATLDGPGCVLIVDDEPMVRELACEVLARAGHRVLLGFDGNHGLEVFEAHADEIDLLILDRTMPGRDGLELLAAIRRRRPDVPAIISSGYAEHSGSQKLSSLGVDAVLQKPWAPHDLLQLLDDLGMASHSPSTRLPRASAS